MISNIARNRWIRQLRKQANGLIVKVEHIRKETHLFTFDYDVVRVYDPNNSRIVSQYAVNHCRTSKRRAVKA